MTYDPLYMTGATQDEVWPLIRDFHYSKRMPSAVHHCFAWRKEGGLFGDTGEPVAAAIYGQPVNRHLPQDAFELQRLVRREDFDGKLSAFVAWSLRWLRANTDAPFALSYADSAQSHCGIIYQSTGWKYVGEQGLTWSGFCGYMTPDGKFVHNRTCNARYGTNSRSKILELFPDWKPVEALPKHLYVFPLRQRLNAVLRRFDWQELPYPKNNAACLVDEQKPICASQERTLEAAP